MSGIAPGTHIYVLGRGIAGLSVAYELLCHGFRVTVVAPEKLEGTATHAAVGVASVKGHILGSQALFRAKIAAQQALPAWIKRVEASSGCQISHAFDGILEPFFDWPHYGAIKDRVFHRMFTGCMGVESLNSNDFREATGERDDVFQQPLGAFHYRSDGWYDPTSMLRALEQTLLRSAVNLVNAQVIRLMPHADGGTSLVTTQGNLHALHVVVACGVFANQLLQSSDICFPQQDAVEGETVVGKHDGAALTKPVALNAGKMNLVVNDRGCVRFGSSSRRHRSLDGALLRGSGEASSAEVLLQKAASYVFFQPEQTLWGVRGCFKDQSPTFGPLFWADNSRRLWLLLGFHKSGLQLGPFFARKLVRLMLGESSSADDLAFSPARF